MQEYWELYLKTLDGAPAIVSFNAGIAEEAVRENLMVMGFIKLKMHTPDDKGMISKEEETKLSFIEDSIEMAVLRYKIGNYVGRIVTQGEIHFIFYLKHDFEWEDVVAYAFKEIDDYEYSSASKMDAEWEIYQKLLFPTTREWQVIQNHHACDQLLDKGDDLHQVRAIEHSAFFNTQKDCEHFIKQIEMDGFSVQKYHEDSDKKLFHLSFFRKDKAFYHDIDALTLQLISCAQHANGQYDGWESAIVK